MFTLPCHISLRRATRPLVYLKRICAPFCTKAAADVCLSNLRFGYTQLPYVRALRKYFRCPLYYNYKLHRRYFARISFIVYHYDVKRERIMTYQKEACRTERHDYRYAYNPPYIFGVVRHNRIHDKVNQSGEINPQTNDEYGKINRICQNLCCLLSIVTSCKKISLTSIFVTNRRIALSLQYTQHALA